MINLAPIAERLTTAGLLRVLGVLEYSELTNPPPLLPAHYVIPFDIAAQPARLAGIHDQLVSATFAVITIVAASAVRAERPSEDLRREVGLVEDALIGWRAPDTTRPIELVGGQLLSAGGRQAIWRSRFRTEYHIRRSAQ